MIWNILGVVVIVMVLVVAYSCAVVAGRADDDAS